MLILSVAAFLTALGFLAWVLGSYFEYPEFAVIGGTIVIVVGSAVSLGGLHYHDGQTEVQVSNNTTEADFQYDRMSEPTSFSLGNVIMLLGVAMILRPLAKEGVE